MNRLTAFLRGRGWVGRSHAIRRQVVASCMGISVREVKKLAEEARLKGTPLLYSTDSRRGGIYLAENEAEIQGGIDKMTRLAVSILRERRALKLALKKRQESVRQKELFG